MVNPEGKVCKKEQGTNKGPIVCTICVFCRIHFGTSLPKRCWRSRSMRTTWRRLLTKQPPFILLLCYLSEGHTIEPSLCLVLWAMTLWTLFFSLLGMSPTKRWNSICGSSQPSILLSEGVWLAPCRALASDNGCTWKFLGTNLQRVKP